MALQITEFNGVFSVHGVLNGANVAILQKHIGMFMHPDHPVVLNLERLKGIDSCAVHALRQLYIKAMRSNSILSILGKENNTIVNVFNSTKNSYILSNDRV